jgi:hypothetical protein
MLPGLPLPSSLARLSPPFPPPSLPPSLPPPFPSPLPSPSLQRESTTVKELEIIRRRRLSEPLPDTVVFNGQTFMDFSGKTSRVRDHRTHACRPGFATPCLPVYPTAHLLCAVWLTAAALACPGRRRSEPPVRALRMCCATVPPGHGSLHRRVCGRSEHTGSGVQLHS